MLTTLDVLMNHLLKRKKLYTCIYVGYSHSNTSWHVHACASNGHT